MSIRITPAFLKALQACDEGIQQFRDYATTFNTTNRPPAMTERLQDEGLLDTLDSDVILHLANADGVFTPHSDMTRFMRRNLVVSARSHPVAHSDICYRLLELLFECAGQTVPEFAPLAARLRAARPPVPSWQYSVHWQTVEHAHALRAANTIIGYTPEVNAVLVEAYPLLIALAQTFSGIRRHDLVMIVDQIDYNNCMLTADRNAIFYVMTDSIVAPCYELLFRARTGAYDPNKPEHRTAWQETATDVQDMAEKILLNAAQNILARAVNVGSNP